MATALELDRTEETGIVALVEANPVMVLTDRQKFNRFYEEIKRETDALEADVSTEKGRKAIASMAYRVAQTKTAIDAAGKKLNEDARARINAVDESRREIREQLDALKEEVRRPLTDWETAEEARLEECKRVLDTLQHAAGVGYDETSADVRGRLGEIEAMAFDPDAFAGYLSQASALRAQAITALTAAAERIEKEEADAAELNRLRAEAAEREAREAAAREERERVERERIAAESEEQRRRDAEEAEAARIRQAEERAAATAREEAAARAREAEAERERAHEAALAQERHQREEIERIAKQEREERERLEATRRAEEEHAAAERARREADRAHRGKIMGAAKDAIMEAGPVEEPIARAIVLAIAAGNVPNVTLAF